MDPTDWPKPDLVSSIGRAWKLVHTFGPDAPPAWSASLETWRMNRKSVMPWNWWQASVIDLKDIPGVKPAYKQYPEAEYELMIVSIDPKWEPTLDASEKTSTPFLSPSDIVYQFHGVGEQGAIKLLRLAMKAMVHGVLTPDSDFQQQFISSLNDTVAHMKAGVHAMG